MLTAKTDFQVLLESLVPHSEGQKDNQEMLDQLDSVVQTSKDQKDLLVILVQRESLELLVMVLLVHQVNISY